jgi:anti-sigma factor RsiW
MDETPRAGRSRSVEELLDEIDRLRAEVEALREAPREARQPDDAQPDDAEPEATSRRGMLRLAGAATAAAIAGGLAKASPAGAADPNDVVRDANNAVAGTTILSGNRNVSRSM